MLEETVIQYCNEYFKRRPYQAWFDKYERLLQHFGLSYYNGSTVHLDLVQWATTPFWNKINRGIKDKLLKTDVPFLKFLLEKNFNYIFLNGITVVSEVCKHLEIKTEEVKINKGNMAFTIYTGKYRTSNIFGWSIYLQSAAVGSYDNVDKIAEEVKRISDLHLTIGVADARKDRSTTGF